jgi:hypothetical protein
VIHQLVLFVIRDLDDLIILAFQLARVNIIWMEVIVANAIKNASNAQEQVRIALLVYFQGLANLTLQIRAAS